MHVAGRSDAEVYVLSGRSEKANKATRKKKPVEKWVPTLLAILEEENLA
jgi:hypothetical protein